MIETITNGETVESFRPCLKRYSRFANFFSQPPVGGNTRVVVRFERVVKPSSLLDGSMHSYVINHYAGWRGSVRIRVIPRARDAFVDDGARNYVPIKNFVSTLSRSNAITDSSTTDYQQPELEDDFWTGEQVSVYTMGQTMSVELPYYSPQRFHYFDTSPLAFKFTQYGSNPGRNSFYEFVDDAVMAVGEDFNLFFFLGVMPFYRAA